MGLNGIDIASYQKTLVPSQMTSTDFIIIKATQGNSYLNPTFKTQYQQAKAAGKLLGIYHYIDGSGADAEANYFVNAVKSVNGIGEAILAVDEQSNQNSQYGNVNYVKQLMDKIYSLTGVKPFLYISHSIASKYNSIANAGYPLWGAQYANYNQTNYQSSPWRDGQNWGNWGADPTIRQYSSTGRITGYGGNLDLDLFYGTKEDWKKYVKSEQQTTASSQKTTTTTIKSTIDFSKYYNKVSNSGGDQRWGIRGGAAGDQTGHEWEIKAWYSYPWNCVLRHPDAKVRELIAELSIEAANNDNIGYDQGQRDTFWQQLQKIGYRPAKITTGCESDCSAGVIALTKSAGYLLNVSALKNISATYTGNMRTIYKNAGFQVLTDSKYLTSSAYLVPGDILLNDNNHVCTNLGIGSKSGYTQTDGVNTPIVAVFSYDSKELQTMLNAAGWSLTVDGIEGPKTVQAIRDFQTIYKLSVTGTVDENMYKILREVYGYVKDGFDANYYSNTYKDLKQAFGTDKKRLLEHYWEYGKKEGRKCKETAAAAPTQTQSSSKPAQTGPAAVPMYSSKTGWTKTPVRQGKITANLLNIRTQPTIHSSNLISYPVLKTGTIVGVCMQTKDEDGDPWYYIRIIGAKGQKFGFASGTYIQLI